MNATVNRETAFVIEMANEVIPEHEADGCCTPAEPCPVVAMYQRKLAEFAQGKQEMGTRDPEPERAGHRPAAGARAGNQYGTFSVKYATDRQMWFLRKCLEERELAPLSGRNADIVTKARIALEAGQISKRLSSDALDILTTLQYKEGAAYAPRLASEKQVALIVKLCGEKDWSTVLTEAYTSETAARLTAKEASSTIDSLFGCDYKPRPEKTEAVVLESGIYRVDETIYKVYWNQAKTHMLAKTLHLHSDGDASWEYAGAAARFVKADQRMSLEDAKAFGAIYGVCCNCGRTLTDETSIEAGIGPVCAARFQ